MAGIVQRAREKASSRASSRGSGRCCGGSCCGVSDSCLPKPEERIDRASTRDLESWAENVLDAGTLDEVFDSNH